jgi:hypothetical protein
MVSARPSAPRENRVSIYDHVLAHVPEAGPGLLLGGNRLPDDPEPDPSGEATVSFAPGLMDEILEQGTAVANEQAAAASFQLIQDVLRHPSAPGPYEALIEDLRGKENLGFLDPLLSRVYDAELPRGEIRDLALGLATRSSDRTPVKVGITLLGLCATIEDRNILLSLGRHEEFTHYAGVSLTSAFEDAEPLLWELAKVVESWGRINLVRQLASTRGPEIKAWILKEGSEGFPAQFMLAYIAATTGELASALSAQAIDDVVYMAAGRILMDLIAARTNPTLKDIDDYTDAPEAIRRYLAHAARKQDTLEGFAPLALIVDYLELRSGEEPSELGGKEHRRNRRPLPKGWTKKERERSATYARWILQRSAWPELIQDGLGSEDVRTFHLAEHAARWLGDDTFPVILDRIRRSPADDSVWTEATRRAQDIGQWNEVLQAATERLSRHDTRETEMFPWWMLMISQEMQRFPGMGWPLVRAALEGPLVIERRFGLRGLSWFLEDGWRWPTDADDVLDLMARSDPDQQTRGWATDLLELGQSPGRITTP